jgi:DNA-binding MarR family transcriptional regulator
MVSKSAPVVYLTDPERKAEIVRLLIEAGDNMKTVIVKTLEKYDAPASVADTLWALASSEKRATLRDIASRLGRDPSTVSLMVDKLARAGLVMRGLHPTDGRKRVLELTDRGGALWKELQDRLHRSQPFIDLDVDDQRLLLGLLRRLSL